MTGARAAEAERERRCRRNVPAQSQTGTSEENAKEGKGGVEKRSQWDEKVKIKQEILTRTNKNGCSVKKKKENREKLGPGRAGHGDSDLFLMPLTGDQQKECIITAPMNNADRLLLISHSRTRTRRCRRDGKNMWRVCVQAELPSAAVRQVGRL